MNRVVIVVLLLIVYAQSCVSIIYGNAPYSIELTSTAIYIGNEARILRGGSLQWFRLPPEEWEDRIEKFKAMGYNLIDMYVAWRNHEPEEGQFDFETFDLVAFLDLAKKHGLYVYIRPGVWVF